MYTIARYIVLLIYKIVYNLSYEGVENIPKEGGRIYASNHRSYADPVLISLPVRKRFAYMAKEELFKNPFFCTHKVYGRISRCKRKWRYESNR